MDSRPEKIRKGIKEAAEEARTGYVPPPLQYDEAEPATRNTADPSPFLPTRIIFGLSIAIGFILLVIVFSGKFEKYPVTITAVATTVAAIVTILAAKIESKH